MKKLFVVRLCLGVYALGFYFTMSYAILSMQFNLIFLTNWGIVMVTLYFYAVLVQMILQYLTKQDNFIPGLWKCTHILFELAITYELVIVVVFWAIIYP